jgi:hypothetical protein
MIAMVLNGKTQKKKLIMTSFVYGSTHFLAH